MRYAYCTKNTSSLSTRIELLAQLFGDNNLMNPHPHIHRMRKLAPMALVLLSAIIAMFAYWHALNYPFIFDDYVYVSENTQLAGLHLSELWRLFTKPYNGFLEFLPLRDLSYWFDIQLFGLTPSAYRIHNILLYLISMALVYVTTLNVWRYFRPEDTSSAPWAAAAVTALFALHPAHVETVVWISGRKDVLSSLFSLLALWLAMIAKRDHGLSAPYAIAALVALFAAMLSKASAVGVAPVIALLWLIFWRDIPTPARRRSQLLWPLASLLLALFAAMVFATIIKSTIPNYFGIEAVTRTLAVLGWLFHLSITPETRHYFHPVFEDPNLSFKVGLGIAALAAGIFGMVILLRKRSLESFALAVFLLLCIPSLQLIPYSLPSLVSDRFIALAVWPIILLIVTLSWRLNPIPRTALLFIIALLWSFQTFNRPHDWKSPQTLADADIRSFPRYYMPVVCKIVDLLSFGSADLALRTTVLITDPEFRDIIAGLPKANLAVANSFVSNKPQEAIIQLWDLWLDHKDLPVQAKWNSPVNNLWKIRKSLFSSNWKSLAEHFPDDVSIRYNAGLWLLSIQEYETAISYFRDAIDSQRIPEFVRAAAYHNLGLALLKSGKAKEAEIPLRSALMQSQPDLGAYCSLAEVYKQTMRLDKATEAEIECHKQVPHQEGPAAH